MEISNHIIKMIYFNQQGAVFVTLIMIVIIPQDSSISPVLDTVDKYHTFA